MPHHTGSKPFREIKWQKGGKERNSPGSVTMFYDTHKKGEVITEKEAQTKYEELRDVTISDPLISDISLIEKCFRDQQKGRVITYGGGVKPKHLKAGKPSSNREVVLEGRLNEA